MQTPLLSLSVVQTTVEEEEPRGCHPSVAHVNGEDPEAMLVAARSSASTALSMARRARPFLAGEGRRGSHGLKVVHGDDWPMEKGQTARYRGR